MVNKEFEKQTYKLLCAITGQVDDEDSDDE